MRLTIISFILFYYASLLGAQELFPSYILETGASFSTGSFSPYLLHSNSSDIRLVNPTYGFARGALYKDIKTSKMFDWSYRLDLVHHFNGKHQPRVHQAYVKGKLGFVQFSGGREEAVHGNQDSLLSSGGLMWSSNARPMTSLKAGVPNYTSVPYTFGLIEFKGELVHGWFEKDRRVKNVYMHHKYLYGRLGGKFPVNLHYGFHHFAQWGGSSPEYGELPSNFSAYKNIFMANEGGSDAPWEEQYNRLGNHLGSRNFGMDIKLRRHELKLYWQTIFEDGSGKAYRNIRDGLWGIAYKRVNPRALVNRVVYELVQTTDQSGPDYGTPEEEIGGNDNYFNHFIYQNGWTYKGRTIGTPLLTSPSYYPEKSVMIWNNKVIAHHIGVSGQVSPFTTYKLLASYSFNQGTNGSPFSPQRENVSMLLELNQMLPRFYHTEITLATGFDTGKMFGNNHGLFVSIRKRGEFKKN